MQFHNPPDAYDSLKLDKETMEQLDEFLKNAKETGRFEFPWIHDPDILTLESGGYWVYKTMYPVVRAEKESNLEEFFRIEQQKKDVYSFPESFTPTNMITLSAVGDLMNTYGLENSKDRLYEEVANFIFDVDISIANLESTLTNSEVDAHSIVGMENPKINATRKQYEAVIGHQGMKYSLFHLANNHILDCGMEGFQTTHQQVKKDKIAFFGTNLNPGDELKGHIIEKKGIKLGFVGFTYSLNDREFPEGKKFLVNTIPFHKLDSEIDLNPIQTQVDYCKSQNCDFIILSLHWGLEYEFFPLKRQVDMAHELAEYGVDMIISHHAHVPQVNEHYKLKRDPSRIVPILYGLGNLLGMELNPYSSLSLIVNFALTKGQLKGVEQTYVEKLHLTPVYFMEEPDGEDYYIVLKQLQHSLKEQHDDPTMEKFVQEVKKYADIVLGKNWETPFN